MPSPFNRAVLFPATDPADMQQAAPAIHPNYPFLWLGTQPAQPALPVAWPCDRAQPVGRERKPNLPLHCLAFWTLPRVEQDTGPP